jgi:hypothetical protein
MTLYVSMDDKPVKNRISLPQALWNCRKVNLLGVNLETNSTHH